MRLTIKVALMIFINLSRIDVSKEWAIIDIRHPGLPNDNPEYSADSHWINVYCQKNWKSVIIEDEDGRVEIKLMGELSFTTLFLIVLVALATRTLFHK
ncbi:unnamed protein product [Rhizophagus irregularis]|nr:unnamed protein product [Rhizophagus irregularis]